MSRSEIDLSERSLSSLQHLAALRGHEDIALFLIQEGVDINMKGNFTIQESKYGFICYPNRSTTL